MHRLPGLDDLGSWISLLLFLLLFHFLNKDGAEVNLGVSLNWVAESLDIGGGFCSEEVQPQTQIVIHGNICNVAVNHSRYDMAADALYVRFFFCCTILPPPSSRLLLQ
jgi:hypothetical protein